VQEENEKKLLVDAETGVEREILDKQLLADYLLET